MVERSINGGAFAPIATLGANVTTYPDTTVLAATTYSYRVKALNLVGQSAYSNTIQVIVPAPPLAPTALTAALQTGPQVSLTWRDNASNETGFIVERSTNGVTFVQIGTPGPRTGTGNVTYADTTVQPGFTYFYRVAARNAFVKSAYTNTATVGVLLPGKPTITSLTSARQGSQERVTARWTDVTGETGYTIQWSATNWGTVAGSGSAAANATQFTTGNIARQTWWFRVGATDAVGKVWSDPVSVMPAP